jgi:hypothetical protein
LAEIRQTLQQLRAELLSNNRDLGPVTDQAPSAPVRSGDKPEAGSAESLPTLSV